MSPAPAYNPRHEANAQSGPAGRPPASTAGGIIGQPCGAHDEKDRRVSRRRLRVKFANARTLGAIIATAILVLVAAACGGNPSSTGSDAKAPANTQSVSSQPLAFSRCMRSHGVPNFPDPNSSGVWPKSQVAGAANNPEYPAAARACGHLLPDGGPGVAPSRAVDQEIQTDMERFARCMRSHGVPNWPDPTLDRGRAIFDPQAAGIDASSPQISDKVHECEHVFPASLGIPPGA
jgi:hypothetical protein